MGIQEEVIAKIMQEELKVLDQRYQELNEAKTQIEKDMAMVKAQFDCIVRIANTANSRIAQLAKATQTNLEQKMNSQEQVAEVPKVTPTAVIEEPKPTMQETTPAVEEVKKSKVTKTKKEDPPEASLVQEETPVTTNSPTEDDEEWGTLPPLTNRKEPVTTGPAASEDDWLD